MINSFKHYDYDGLLGLSEAEHIPIMNKCVITEHSL